MFGDFDFPQIDWIKLPSILNASTSFINMTLHFNLSQVVTKPTCGSNVLDLIFTIARETVSNITHLDGFGDHELIQITMKFPFPFTEVKRKNIRDNNRANYAIINAELGVLRQNTTALTL